MKIKVPDVVREMDLPGPDFTAYLNRRTGEFVSTSAEEAEALESEAPDEILDWMSDILPKLREVTVSQDWVALPDPFEIHEWEIMHGFARSISNSEVSNLLLNALHGRGAFRYFKDQLRVHDLTDRWYEYRERAFEEIAIDWLEANGIPYERDAGDV